MSYQDILRIPEDSIVLGEMLGSGFFGTVFKGHCKGKDVAIKTKNLNSMGYMTEKDLLEEARFMSNLDHGNLVKCYGIVKWEDSIGIVMEYMSKGSLKMYFQTSEGKSSTFFDLICMTEQVASGLAYMELKGCCHGDIHSGNILVGENRVCKVADFGLAHCLDYSRYIGAYRSIFSTIMAPELTTGGSYTIESDVYHFGFLMYGIFTRGEYWFGPIGGDCPAGVQVWIMKCISHNPSDRPSFKELERRLGHWRNNGL